MSASSSDWPRSGYKPGGMATTPPGRSQPLPAVRRKTKYDPSAWIGLGLMVANSVVALVDLILLAGNFPH